MEEKKLQDTIAALKRMGSRLSPLFSKHEVDKKLPVAAEWFNAVEGAPRALKTAVELLSQQDEEIKHLKAFIRKMPLSMTKKTKDIIEREERFQRIGKALEDSVVRITGVLDFKKKNRKDEYLFARTHAASILYDCYKDDGMSYQWIGDYLNGRDHSTILYSITVTHPNFMKTKKGYREVHDAIMLEFVNNLSKPAKTFINLKRKH